MDAMRIINDNKGNLERLCRKYRVTELDAFGSVVTGDFDENKSDIDFLVEFDSSVRENRFDNFFALLEELRKLFQRPVDLVERGGMKNPYFVEQVNNTRRKIYGDS